ncbi:unnamed protein product [Dibothriocephalus latus]|uniref:Uncharacterized protein n=1 Tax=Dibothriocephalus latus TaxID=60516 RepID=A0A3P7NW51_DIBLA|nr:unnamed protein product [Dibothriocephalus latus]
MSRTPLNDADTGSGSVMNRMAHTKLSLMRDKCYTTLTVCSLKRAVTGSSQVCLMICYSFILRVRDLFYLTALCSCSSYFIS